MELRCSGTCTLGIFIVRKTILLFILSLMFAYLLYPLVELLQRRFRFRTRMPALVLPFAAILLLLTTGGFFLRGPVCDESRNLEQQIGSTEFKKNLAQWHVLGLPIGEKIVDGHSLNKIQTQLKDQLMGMMPQLGRGLSRAVRDIGNIFIVPILGFFMLKDGRQICSTLVEFCFHPNSGAEAKAKRRAVENILEDAHSLILQYMRALVLLCFVVLIVFGVVLKVMEVRYALLMAILAFSLEFIPLVGPLVAGMTIVAVCEFNRYPHLSWIVVFLIAYRLFQDYVLSPHLMKKSVQLHPLLVIFGIFAGGEIGGIGGIFLSVPLLALARLVFYEYRKHTIACLESSAQPV
jgi:predicted PurR-regulated permease PerM